MRLRTLQMGLPALVRLAIGTESMKKAVAALVTALLVWPMAATGFAQGVQTSTIRGVVKDQQGLTMPGVAVTASSPVLQGQRTAVTEMDGA